MSELTATTFIYDFNVKKKKFENDDIQP